MPVLASVFISLTVIHTSYGLACPWGYDSPVTSSGKKIDLPKDFDFSAVSYTGCQPACRNEANCKTYTYCSFGGPISCVAGSILEIDDFGMVLDDDADCTTSQLVCLPALTTEAETSTASTGHLTGGLAYTLTDAQGDGVTFRSFLYKYRTVAGTNTTVDLGGRGSRTRCAAVCSYQHQNCDAFVYQAPDSCVLIFSP